MKKFNLIYLKVCIVIALIFALIIAFYDAVSTEEFVAKVNNPPQNEDYQLLKDYAILYAETFDKNSVDDKNVQITHNIEENHLTITVNELRCGVKATFPVEVKKAENEEVTVIISYQDVSYIEYTNLKSMGLYVAAIILFAIMVFFISFIAIYFPIILVVWLIFKIIASRRKKEQEGNA